MDQESQSKKMSQLIAKCWADEGFKKKLLAHPAATLKAIGLELPAGLSPKVLANNNKVFHLVIPAKPKDLSDEDLDAAIIISMCMSSTCGCTGFMCACGGDA